MDHWWQDGVRFECQGSGRCCTARGEYGYVYVTLPERRRLAAHLGLATAVFTRRYCERTDGEWHLANPEADCGFLEGTRCSVYPARPDQCRTWPFWPEHMSPRAWAREVASFCPGVGRGPVVSGETIRSLLVV